MMSTVINTKSGYKNTYKKRLVLDLPLIEHRSTSRIKLTSRDSRSTSTSSSRFSRSKSRSNTHRNALQIRRKIPNGILGKSLPPLVKNRYSNDIDLLPAERCRSRSTFEDELKQQFDSLNKMVDLYLPFLAGYGYSRSTCHPKSSNSKTILTPRNDPVLLEARQVLERAREVDKGKRNLHEKQNSNASCQNQRDEDTDKCRSEDVGDISNNKPTEGPLIVIDEVETIDANEINEPNYVDYLDNPEFDYDGPFVPTESYDLTHFDFDHLTKPRRRKLAINQEEYLRVCRYYGILPSAFILRHLVTSELRLCGQQLGTVRIKALSSALAANCTVYDLEISEDVIDDQAMQYLVDALQENNSIEQLSLRDNQMGRQPVKLLMSHLDQYDRLFSLNLAGNELEDTDGDLFANYLANSVNLVNLDLSHNMFRDEAPEIIAKALGKNTTMSHLSLAWNHIRQDGMRRFLVAMAKNHSVEAMNISWNGMSTSVIGSLSALLKRNNTLVSLDVSACRINSGQLMELTGALTKAKTIRSLILGHNPLSDQDISLALKQLLQAKGALSLKEIDFLGKVISNETYGLCQQLLDKRDILVIHGNVLGMAARTLTDADELDSMNPMTVLIELGRLLDMSLKELFTFMDKDDSKTLTREEIKAGLQEFDIPLPERSLDLLIRRMDTDGDGEISITELALTGSVTSRTRLKERVLVRGAKMADKRTETERCRKILRRLMAIRQTAKADLLKKQRKLDKVIKKKRALRKKAKSLADAEAAGEGEGADVAVSEDVEEEDEDEEEGDYGYDDGEYVGDEDVLEDGVKVVDVQNTD